MNPFDTHYRNPQFKDGVRYFILPNAKELDPPSVVPKALRRAWMTEVYQALQAGPRTAGEVFRAIRREETDVRVVGNALAQLVKKGMVRVVDTRPRAAFHFGRTTENVYARVGATT